MTQIASSSSATAVASASASFNASASQQSSSSSTVVRGRSQKVSQGMTLLQKHLILIHEYSVFFQQSVQARSLSATRATAHAESNYASRKCSLVPPLIFYIP